MERIGLLGGSYNPAHRGHRHIAEEAQRIMGLDEVWMWMSHNIFKDRANYASSEDRKNILDLYAKDRPWMKIHDMEKDFCGSTTANTLTLLQAMFPTKRFIWIFGDDNFANFHTWDNESHKVHDVVTPDWKYMMHNFPIAVLHRPGSRREAQRSIAAHQFAHTQVKDPQELGHSKNGWSFIKNKPMEVSSTQIKRSLLAHRHNIRGLTPEVEQYIYDKGLFNTRRDFNAVAAPAPVPNTVPLNTFTLLAATANLLKASMKDVGGFEPGEFIAHAAASWDKSFAKGDFNKQEEVAGELADNAISLHWVGQMECVFLRTSMRGKESQGSVSSWCDEHYPNEDLKQRLKNCLEELTELCVCEGLEKDRMVNLLTLVLEDPQAVDVAAACRTTLDRLNDYADALGLNLQTALDEKMQINRARSTEQSAARKAAKFNGPTPT